MSNTTRDKFLNNHDSLLDNDVNKCRKYVSLFDKDSLEMIHFAFQSAFLQGDTKDNGFKFTYGGIIENGVAKALNVKNKCFVLGHDAKKYDLRFSSDKFEDVSIKASKSGKFSVTLKNFHGNSVEMDKHVITFNVVYDDINRDEKKIHVYIFTAFMIQNFSKPSNSAFNISSRFRKYIQEKWPDLCISFSETNVVKNALQKAKNSRKFKKIEELVQDQQDALLELFKDCKLEINDN